MSAELRKAVNRVSHSLQLICGALGMIHQLDRFQNDESDYVRDPRYAVPVSRFGEAKPPVKRDTLPVRIGTSDGKSPVMAKRVKDQLDALFERGAITQNAYNAGKLFQMEFERCGYERCRTTNYGGSSGGAMSIEDIYARSSSARDYVHNVFRLLGGPTSKLSLTVYHYVGVGDDVKSLAGMFGKSRDYWTGILHTALEMMGDEYQQMMRGRQRRAAVTGYHDEHTVPERGGVINFVHDS